MVDLSGSTLTHKRAANDFDQSRCCQAGYTKQSFLDRNHRAEETHAAVRLEHLRAQPSDTINHNGVITNSNEWMGGG